MCHSNCCVNPIIYCFINHSFQRNLLRTLRCRCREAHPGGTSVGGGRPVTLACGVFARRASGGADTELNAMNGADTTLTGVSLNTADLPSTFV